MADSLKIVMEAKGKLLTSLMQFDTKFKSSFYSNYERITQVEVNKKARLEEWEFPSPYQAKTKFPFQENDKKWDHLCTK